MSNPFELPKKLLHKVIIRTIDIDNISNDIIRKYFGLKLEFSDKEENWRVLNLKKIEMFNEFFLDNFGASPRAEILLKIFEDKNGKEKLKSFKGFRNKLIDFYKIRNIFAHKIYPIGLDGKSKLDLSEPYWGELNEKHEKLCNEIKNFLNQDLK